MGMQYLLPTQRSDSQPEVMQNVRSETREQNSEKRLGLAIEAAIHAARRDERLVQGLLDSATVLQEAPARACVCLIGADERDVAFHIHSTLLAAYCLEYGIPLLKVDSLDKFVCPVDVRSKQCFVILAGPDTSPAEKLLLKHGTGSQPAPVIRLPG